MPAPLVADTAYYAIPVNGDAFQVSATPGGSAIDLTTAGSRFVVIAPINYSASIAFASRLIDELTVGQVVLRAGEPIPEIIKMVCAQIAVGQLALISGSVSTSLAEIVKGAKSLLDGWAKGQPLRAENRSAAANVAASASVPYLDSRGWNRFGRL